MDRFALWRRLDVPGHDACRLRRAPGGWRLAGTAVSVQDGAPAALAYEVTCDSDWVTRAGRVHGWVGAEEVDIAVERGAGGGWTVDGISVAGMEDRLDLDLGFTPATNLIQLNRLDLALGQSASAPVVWLAPPTCALEPLDQSYERRSESAYWYEAPRSGYAAMLEVDADGFVNDYPGLWTRER